ncbi:MAG: alpha/beta hydrolase [Chloroflexota bacterium]
MAEKKSSRAGLRGADWNPAELPQDMVQQSLIARTQDGATVRGVLYCLGGEETAVLAAHPRESINTHYLVPAMLKAGVAVYLQAPRSIGNDIRLEHERALYDVAAGMSLLQERGYSKIVFLGNSGGAGLLTFYLQQANTPQNGRITHSPGGRPTKLETAVLPPADGLILVSPHLGQGMLLLNEIDPSVTDESDALSINPKLSPFMPQNGFKRPPQSSQYSTDFQEAYRAAQKERCARIDAIAKDQIARRMASRKKIKDGKANPMERVIGMHTPIFTVWRTDADLRNWDTSIDPSDRPYGSLWGPNPFASNWGSIGFGRVCTAESWLSTWSGLSSNAAMLKCAPAVTQPTLMIRYTADATVFPADAAAMLAAIGAENKESHVFPGDHHGHAVGDGEAGRGPAAETITHWLQQHFPT